MADQTDLSVADFFRFGNEAAEQTAALAVKYPAPQPAAPADEDAETMVR